ncbi:hypothetical protein [Fulvimarina sp. MAC8]|uniref:hypothetical protein n=1 Tax=Fulvimarina sp. MAC8 TaxID=3162874 RepID=UPI0032ED03DB
MFLFVALAGPAAATSVDAAFVELEQVREAYQAGANASAEVRPSDWASRAGDAEAAEEALKKAASNSFDVDAAMQAIDAALEKEPQVSLDEGAFAAAASHYRQIRRTGLKAMRDAGPDIDKTVADRPDGADIRALADLMAAPLLAAEVARMSSRASYMLDTSLVDPKALSSAIDEDSIEGVVDQMIEASRPAGTNEGSGQLPPELMREIEGKAVVAVLLQLSPDEVQSLLEFYESPAGRAKREALVETFKARAENDMREFLVNYLQRMSKPAP